MTKALSLHKKLKGKIVIGSKLPALSPRELSLIYTPGVAEVVRYISEKSSRVYDVTIKANTVAVVTDGSAVLGLGNVGAQASLPVMEGKCALFSLLAGINAFPICLATQDAHQIVQTIRYLAPVFGGINLEDIAAPKCFEIEGELQDLGIPVVHDDQHATAIVVLAGLINAVKVVDKNLKKCKIVIVGAGAAGNAVTKLLHAYGCKRLIVVDSHGIISSKRRDLDIYKTFLGTLSNLKNLSGNIEDACQNADILIGVSKRGLFTSPVMQALNKNAIVFALANPDPEILPDEAKKQGVAIVATGRNDFPNQVNNALVFPGLFKGLLKSRKTALTDELKLTSAIALASLVPNPTPEKIIPSLFDKNVVPTITRAIVQS